MSRKQDIDCGVRRKHRKKVESLLGRKLGPNEIVHHKDGNCRNGDIGNLVIMPRSAHSSYHMTGFVIPDSTKLKLQEKGRLRRSGAKLDIEQVRDIRKMLKDGIRQFVIAFAFGVSRAAISDINMNRKWQWV